MNKTEKDYVKKLIDCPFCGSSDIEVVRPGTNKHSCIVQCADCGCTLESNELGYGKFWNIRIKRG